MIVRRSALVPRPASHVFDVIEAAEHYPQFLPWCTAATIVSRDAAMVSADLRVQWGGMRFEMRTRNPKLRPSMMSIHLERGPFRRFEGEWRLTELSADACKVAFVLDYEFENRLMTSAAGPVFNRLGDTLLDAFVERALAMPVMAAHAEVGSLFLEGEGGGRSGSFEPHAASPLSDAGLQASLRTAGEGEELARRISHETASTQNIGPRVPGFDLPSPQPSPWKGEGVATTPVQAPAPDAAVATAAATEAPLSNPVDPSSTAAPAASADAPQPPPVDVPADPAQGQTSS